MFNLINQMSFTYNGEVRDFSSVSGDHGPRSRLLYSRERYAGSSHRISLLFCLIRFHGLTARGCFSHWASGCPCVCPSACSYCCWLTKLLPSFTFYFWPLSGDRVSFSSGQPLLVKQIHLKAGFRSDQSLSGDHLALKPHAVLLLWQLGTC